MLWKRHIQRRKVRSGLLSGDYTCFTFRKGAYLKGRYHIHRKFLRCNKPHTTGFLKTPILTAIKILTSSVFLLCPWTHECDRPFSARSCPPIPCLVCYKPNYSYLRFPSASTCVYSTCSGCRDASGNVSDPGALCQG